MPTEDGTPIVVHAFAAKTAKAPLLPFDYEPSALGPEEVDVRVTHCGICHTDVAMVDNDWGFSQYPGRTRARGRSASFRRSART